MGWITTDDAAAIIGVSAIRVRQYLTEKRLKSKKFGRSWMVDEQSAREFKKLPLGRPKNDAPKRKRGTK